MDTLLLLILGALWVTLVVIVWRRRNYHTIQRLQCHRAAQERRYPHIDTRC